MLAGDRNIRPRRRGRGTYGGRETHLDGQHLVERALAQGDQRSLNECAKSCLILHKKVARFPGQVTKRAEEDNCLDVRVPVGGSKELHLDRAEAMPLQHEYFVTERATDLHRGFNITAHLKEIVGVDLVVMLSRVDCERCIAV